MKSTLYILALSLGMGLSFNACNTDDPDPEPVSFANDIQPILTTNCAFGGCHDAFEEAGQLNLTSSASYAELVNVASFLFTGETRVVPGDHSTSVLTQTLRGTRTPAMPLFSPALTEEEIAKIEEWVNDGALDN